ncbi:DEBR0S6_11122g1_1 [Brettanomyces bruxellensis]|uniref:DEBR0S6_11122g1_1 n=1 Tax=Dekkera bruxellensis TaxID=5007 RepID=A0A7D9H2J0_DEKBR|nr:DEBR0S6_11122g1_1 [Brettanomyces bruxellensis]
MLSNELEGVCRYYRMDRDSSAYFCKAMLIFAKKSWKGTDTIRYIRNKMHFSTVAQLEYISGVIAERFMNFLNLQPLHMFKLPESKGYPLFQFNVDMRFVGPSLATLLVSQHIQTSSSTNIGLNYVYTVNLMLNFLCLDVAAIRDFHKKLVKYFSEGKFWGSRSSPDWLVSNNELILEDIDVSTTVIEMFKDKNERIRGYN